MRKREKNGEDLRGGKGLRGERGEGCTTLCGRSGKGPSSFPPRSLLQDLLNRATLVTVAHLQNAHA